MKKTGGTYPHMDSLMRRCLTEYEDIGFFLSSIGKGHRWDKHKMAIVYRYMVGESVDDIAKWYGVTQSAVCQWLKRAERIAAKVQDHETQMEAITRAVCEKP
jgi:hypothetical protein